MFHTAFASEPDHIFLAGGLDDFPTAFEAGSDDKTVPDPDFPAPPAFFADDGAAGKNVAELPFVIFDTPFSRRTLPNACKKRSFGVLLQIPCAELGAT